jgi:hypothetical protein
MRRYDYRLIYKGYIIVKRLQVFIPSAALLAGNITGHGGSR